MHRIKKKRNFHIFTLLIYACEINISPTIGREDGTFGFGFFEYDTDLSLFIENAEKEIHRVKNSTGLSFSKDTARADVIRYSALPWFAFSEMKHAGSIQTGDSIRNLNAVVA